MCILVTLLLEYEKIQTMKEIRDLNHIIMFYPNTLFKITTIQTESRSQMQDVLNNH